MGLWDVYKSHISITRLCGHRGQVGMYVSMREVHEFFSWMTNRFFFNMHFFMQTTTSNLFADGKERENSKKLSSPTNV